MHNTETFEKYCLGEEFNFYGVCNEDFKLGRKVWRAVEDESDGYRSYLDSIEVTEKLDQIFFDRPLAKVKVVEIQDYDYPRFALVDVKDGHVWLEVGTDQYDDYYPCYRFEYHPKPSKG